MSYYGMTKLPRFGLRVSGAMTYIVQYRNSAGRTQLRWIGRTSRSGSLKERRLKYCERYGQSCDAHDGTVTVDQAYIRANVPVVREQLQRAGVRLAHLLDQALSK